MSALLHAYQGGVSNDQAVQTAFGFSLDELDRQWKAWLDYGGDRLVSATIDPHQSGSGPGSSFDDLVSALGPDIIIAAAALFTLAFGVVLTVRTLSAKEENETL